MQWEQQHHHHNHTLPVIQHSSASEDARVGGHCHPTSFAAANPSSGDEGEATPKSSGGGEDGIDRNRPEPAQAREYWTRWR
jgi:hypothetical protein